MLNISRARQTVFEFSGLDYASWSSFTGFSASNASGTTNFNINASLPVTVAVRMVFNVTGPQSGIKVATCSRPAELASASAAFQQDLGIIAMNYGFVASAACQYTTGAQPVPNGLVNLTLTSTQNVSVTEAFSSIVLAAIDAARFNNNFTRLQPFYRTNTSAGDRVNLVLLPGPLQLQVSFTESFSVMDAVVSGLTAAQIGSGRQAVANALGLPSSQLNTIICTYLAPTFPPPPMPTPPQPPRLPPPGAPQAPGCGPTARLAASAGEKSACCEPNSAS